MSEYFDVPSGFLKLKHKDDRYANIDNVGFSQKNRFNFFLEKHKVSMIGFLVSFDLKSIK